MMNAPASLLALLAAGISAPLLLLPDAATAQATDSTTPTPPVYPYPIYPHTANLTCGANDTSPEHINPCVTDGPGLYPHGMWWSSYEFDNGAQTYIECTSSAEANCTVKNTAEGMVWNPYTKSEATECEVLPRCDLLPGGDNPAFNSCLRAFKRADVAGPSVRYVPYDLEGFCNGMPYWLFGPQPSDGGSTQLRDETKAIECGDDGGCTILLCPPGNIWNQAAQACVEQRLDL